MSTLEDSVKAPLKLLQFSLSCGKNHKDGPGSYAQNNAPYRRGRGPITPQSSIRRNPIPQAAKRDLDLRGTLLSHLLRRSRQYNHFNRSAPNNQKLRQHRRCRLVRLVRSPDHLGETALSINELQNLPTNILCIPTIIRKDVLHFLQQIRFPRSALHLRDWECRVCDRTKLKCFHWGPRTSWSRVGGYTSWHNTYSCGECVAAAETDMEQYHW